MKNIGGLIDFIADSMGVPLSILAFVACNFMKWPWRLRRITMKDTPSFVSLFNVFNALVELFPAVAYTKSSRARALASPQHACTSVIVVGVLSFIL